MSGKLLERGAHKRGRRPFGLFRDEDGFTTVGVALALLVTLALVFTSAQVYRVSSASADVQDVADAAALAWNRRRPAKPAEERSAAAPGKNVERMKKYLEDMRK